MQCALQHSGGQLLRTTLVVSTAATACFLLRDGWISSSSLSLSTFIRLCLGAGVRFLLVCTTPVACRGWERQLHQSGETLTVGEAEEGVCHLV
jgi:hypothetical protein